MVDNRIHACLYFIEPTGHSLKPVDIEFMRRLHTKVNLIPIIAKSDTMTDDEVLQFKARILSDIAHHHIDIYQAPQYEQEDEETLAENEEIIVCPFLSFSLSFSESNASKPSSFPPSVKSHSQ
jgi:septin 7